MTKYLYALFLSLLFTCHSIAQNEVLILTVDSDFSDSFQFENVQELYGTVANFSVCRLDRSLPTNVAPASCMMNLSNYDLVMVQGLYSAFNNAFITSLTDYIKEGGSLFFEVDPATVGIPNLETFQEDNINQLLSSVGQPSIEMTLFNQTIIDTAPSILVNGSLSNCIPERVSFATGGAITGDALSNALSLSIGVGVYQAYWDTGFGGRLGIATEYYTSGYTTPASNSNRGAAQMLWEFMRSNPSCLVNGDCNGPELVQNFDFESFVTCPDDSGQLNNALGWGAPAVVPGSTPDYFNSCAPFLIGSDFVNTGGNYRGGRYAYSGEGYAGVHTYTSGAENNREYLITELTTPLITGRSYQISFVYSLANTAAFASDELGMFLTTTEPNNYAPGDTYLAATPQLVTPTGNYLNNKESWGLATSTFTANGGERFVVIGAFHNNGPQQISNSLDNYAYYFIDDVSVRELQTNATLDIGVDVTINAGDSTSLQAITTGGTPISYSWTPALGLNNTTIANPIANPATTTTYTATVYFGDGCMSSDTVTVTVNNPEDSNFQNCSGINNNWYFGTNAGLTFNNGAVTVLTDGQLSTDEGTATISNENGEILFYTDGIRAYNRNGSIMPNATDLKGGSSSAQSAIIFQKPGSTDRYYIFTSEEAGNFNGLQYSEVDMGLEGGLGDVTSVKNVQLVAKITEKLIAIPHANGSDIWILVHRWQSNEFLSFLVTATGVSTTPITSTVGETLNILGKYGTMKVNSEGSRIANTLIETGNVQLFDFDNTNGQLANPQTLTGLFKPYGVEFSPNDRFLYVGESGSIADGSRVFQYDLDAGGMAQIQSSQVVLSNTPRSGGALQIGPDGRIYHSVYNQDALGVIENPNLGGLAAGYLPDAIDLGGNLAKLGLPPSVLCIDSCTDIVLDDTNLEIQKATCDNVTGAIEGILVTGITTDALYEWTNSEGTVVGTSINLMEVEAGSYSLRVSDEDCENSIGPFTIALPENCEEAIDSRLPIRIANTMTPNGDGANDMFFIEGIESYPNSNLIIYNRWGSTVYETNNYQNDWYGTSQGNPLPVATYYYLLHLGDSENTSFKGAITLLK